MPAKAKQAKIVKKGELTKKFALKGVLATAGAKAAIEAAGGSVRSKRLGAGEFRRQSLGGLGKFTELRQRLLFVSAGADRLPHRQLHPGAGHRIRQAMLELMESQQGTIVDMFNMFSGGALERFSLFALNVVPYISASIIVQLMGQIYGPWKAMKKEGESGRRKLTQYSRVGAVFLAVVQGGGIASALQSAGRSRLRPGPASC